MRGSRRWLGVLVAAGSCILGTACVDVPTPPESQLPFEAQIDGQEFVAAGTDFSTYNGGAGLLITGIRPTGAGTYRQVSVQMLKGWHGPGTYTLSALDTVGAFGFVSDHTDDSSELGKWVTTAANPGQMVVTGFYPATQTIKGTFRFVARSDSGQSLSVTEGHFSGSYFIDP